MVVHFFVQEVLMFRLESEVYRHLLKGEVLHTSSVLDELFERAIKNTRIFKNKNVLRHDYIPDKLPHREEQIRYFGEIVAPVLKRDRCSNVFVYGKTGTGKTAVIKYVLSKLLDKTQTLGVPFKMCYVNCRLAGTEYRVFASLCNALSVKVPFTGLAVGEIFDRFKMALDLNRSLFIVVLDEIDELVKTRGDMLLYELTRLNESLTKSKLSLVGISNDLRFKELLDPRVLSSLSEEETVFRAYNAAELHDILLERCDLAFFDEALSEGALSLCAALAAAEHGDARRALDMLRVAGELAEREGAAKITDEHIRNAEKRIEHDRIIDALKNLTPHSKLVLASVYLLSKANVTSAITGDIYEIYQELCGLTGYTTLTQRRVSGLINELDIAGLLNSRVVSMGRYGRTKKIRLSIARGLVAKVFSEDEGFGCLMDYSPKCLTEVSGR
jgi:cell division control protein 6